MKDLHYYIHRFEHLRRASVNGGAPHKPILLLSIIDCIRFGYITDERIYISPELIGFFRSNWAARVKTAHTMNFALPFYHLSGEPFWKLRIKAGYELGLTKSKSIKSFTALHTAVEYATIDKELFLLLKQEKEQLILKHTLIDRYFPGTSVCADRPYPRYLDEISHDILHDTTVAYGRKIRTLQTGVNEETYEEDIFLRSSVFKKQITAIYRHTCCITGLRIDSAFNISMIDACHIVPFSETHDDTVRNGLALCPNLHRAFDRGLITVDTNYRVVISRNFNEKDTTCSHSLRQFDNKPILLPENPDYRPDPANLEWHQRNIFK